MVTGSCRFNSNNNNTMKNHLPCERKKLMKLTDVIDAAVSKTPNLEVEVEVDGEPKDIVFRNVLLMAPDARQKLFDELQDNPTEQGDGDNFTAAAESARNFLRAVCKVKGDFKYVEKELKADKDLEEAAWLHLFNEYQKVTQLGEAVSSQNS